MALPGRASHYVAAGLLTAGGLLWATREAWPWRRPLTAAPIVVTDAYAEFTETLGRRETLAEVLARAGITGRDYAGFLAAAQHLPVRRLRPGLAFQVRRLKTDSLAERVTVRLSPERRDRKSTRLNSSHEWISYAVFCLKKKKKRYVCADRRQHRSVRQGLIQAQAACHAFS